MHSVLRRILPARVVKGGEFFRQAVPQWGKVSFQRQKERSRPISRVLSRAIIHLGSASPRTSSSLPGNSAGHAYGSPIWPCSGWGLPCRFRCRLRGALLPHLFTLTRRTGRFVFCCTGRRLTPPRRYLAPCPMEPGLSSTRETCSDCLADSGAHGTGNRQETLISPLNPAIDPA